MKKRIIIISIHLFAIHIIANAHIQNTSFEAMTFASFDFTVNQRACFDEQSSTYFWIKIDNPQEYAYYWELDGQPFLYNRLQTECLCGEVISIQVTHLESREKVVKVFDAHCKTFYPQEIQ